MSNFPINLIDDINQSKETWRIEVRIMRLWPTFWPQNPTQQSSIEMICEDEKGGNIQASVPYYLIEKFQNRLVESSFYRLNNFEVLNNVGKVQATEHAYKLQFHKMTGVRPLQKPLSIPMYGFRFCEINDILSGEMSANRLVDVIAEVVQCEKLNDSDKDKIRTITKLRDDLGDTINCTFWSSFAIDIVQRWQSVQDSGLCNGTRLVVTKLVERIIEAKILSEKNIGTKVYIPRMSLTPSDSRVPFRFTRRQFPLSVCFAMTINKSQGQTLANVGLYLSKPVFSHGQLYVAVSHVKSRRGLKILCCDEDGVIVNKTANVVYKEIFQKLK